MCYLESFTDMSELLVRMLATCKLSAVSKANNFQRNICANIIYPVLSDLHNFRSSKYLEPLGAPFFVHPTLNKGYCKSRLFLRIGPFVYSDEASLSSRFLNAIFVEQASAVMDR